MTLLQSCPRQIGHFLRLVLTARCGGLLQNLQLTVLEVHAPPPISLRAILGRRFWLILF